jgi:metal-sulfur cluster biosynthetic enzyme
MDKSLTIPEKKRAAIEALRTVMDPELGINIVDLGLIYALYFDEPQRALFCEMTLTTQFCPMGESIINSAGAALQEALPEYDAAIMLRYEPRWNHTMLSAEARQLLNAD